MPLFRKKRPAVVWADFDQELEPDGSLFAFSPDRPKVDDVVIVVPQHDFPRTLENAFWGRILEVQTTSNPYLKRMYRVSLLEPLAPKPTDPISAAYSQTVNTTLGEEREMALHHPEAWAAGIRKAEEVCRGKKLSDFGDAQLRYLADLELVFEPGSEEATVFITAFVRKAQEMIASGEAQ